MVRRKHPLNDRAIQPTAFKTSLLLIDANRPETAGLTEREARLVEGENAGEDFPETTCLSLAEQCLEQRLADATSADVTAQIDREVGDAGVTRTAASCSGLPTPLPRRRPRRPAPGNGTYRQPRAVHP